jgi:hypothetical protein
VVAAPKWLKDSAGAPGWTDTFAEPEHDDNDKPLGSSTVEGTVSKRWDPAVNAKFRELIQELGKQFDGKDGFGGIILSETAINVVNEKQDGTREVPPGYSASAYTTTVNANLDALHDSFHKSVAIQSANFMPGGTPELAKVYAHAKAIGQGMGGPDVKANSHAHAEYPMLQDLARDANNHDSGIPTMLAVENGNIKKDLRTADGRKLGPEIDNLKKIGFTAEWADRMGFEYLFWELDPDDPPTPDVMKWLATPR